jgi:hypothetical protein
VLLYNQKEGREPKKNRKGYKMTAVTVFTSEDEEFKITEKNGTYTYIDEEKEIERESSLEEVQQLVSSGKYEVQELTF